VVYSRGEMVTPFILECGTEKTCISADILLFLAEDETSIHPQKGGTVL